MAGATRIVRKDISIVIDPTSMTLEALWAYDEMMCECVIKVKNIAPLAVGIWSEVLKELDRRGKVRLQHGSYDNIGQALIQRIGWHSGL